MNVFQIYRRTHANNSVIPQMRDGPDGEYHLAIQAIRNIAPYAELTLDYSWVLDLNSQPEVSLLVFACRFHQ